MPLMLWCSASQYRLKPNASACCAVRSAMASASATVPPSRTATRSSMDSGMEDIGVIGSGFQASHGSFQHATVLIDRGDAGVCLVAVVGQRTRDHLVEQVWRH